MAGASAGRNVQVDVELGENAAQVTVTETCEVAELINENGKRRLWEDEVGWFGYLREDGTHYWVNTRHDADDWASKRRVQERTGQEGVERHIRRPDAGDEGFFRRRCSPPRALSTMGPPS